MKRTRFGYGLLLCLGLGTVCLVGCKWTALKIGDDAEAESAPVELAKAGLVAEVASVSGKVVLFGGPPKTLGKVIDVSGDQACGSAEQIIDPTWKVAADGGMAEVVITVAGSARASNLSQEAVLVEQKHCEFTPRVTALQSGQSIRFRNGDEASHELRFYKHDQGTLAVGELVESIPLVEQGTEWVHELRAPGIYRMECEGRDWMRSWVVVHEGIHKAVSDTAGHYLIQRALPDGEYTVSAWHPRFKKAVSKKVMVVNGIANVDFAFDYSKSFDANMTLDS